MFQKFIKFTLLLLISINFTFGSSYSEIVKDIKINGNDRISKDTIIMFSDYPKNSNINSDEDLNLILKNIYESNFFKNVSVDFSNNILIINVEELPIIENIYYEGIKAQKIREKLFKDLSLKQRSSYNEIFLKKDKLKIENSLKDLGYYFSKVEIILTELDDNKVDIKYDIQLGKKAKIKKIIT